MLRQKDGRKYESKAVTTNIIIYIYIYIYDFA